LRIIFLGTPEFAVPTLDALAGMHEVLLVVAQPDKRAGRGLQLQSPAVARYAREHDLPLVQPQKIREALPQIESLKPDIGIVVAYGKILPPDLLRIAPFYNVHASVLPKYRGAAPIQRAIERGEIETGVTIMRVDAELDHGPVLAIETTPIGANEHAPSLSQRLSTLGADLLLRTLGGDRREAPQDHARATFAPKIEKSEGEIRWSDPAKSIYDKFRAFDPWPGVFRGDLKLVDIKPASGSGAAGEILSIDNRAVTVATGDGALDLVVLQRAGKSRQRAAEFVRGAGWRAGAKLE
jgi:methionyl-tRNA formyltransferase